jgi:hypothetical protein
MNAKCERMTRKLGSRVSFLKLSEAQFDKDMPMASHSRKDATRDSSTVDLDDASLDVRCSFLISRKDLNP